MSNHKISCWSCGCAWEFSPPLGRSESCLKCRRDAKSCLNCKFHDRHANGECAESQAELVKDKEKSNFCDWFDAKHTDAIQLAENPQVSPLDQLFGGASTKVKSSLEIELEAFLNKTN